MAIHEIRVTSKGEDPKGKGVFNDIQRTIGLPNLTDVRTARIYRVEGATEEEAEKLAQNLFAESIDQDHSLNKPLITDVSQTLEVAYKPGVMNPEAESIMKASKALGVDLKAADSSTQYAFYGPVSPDEVEQVVNRG